MVFINMRQCCDGGQRDSTPGMRPLPLLLHICAAAADYTQLQTLITPPCVRDTGYSNVSFQKQEHPSYCGSAAGRDKNISRFEQTFPKGFKITFFFPSKCQLFCLSCCSSFFLCMGPSPMPESCVVWQRRGNDVDRRGNNNENTIKSRLHRLFGKMWRKGCRVWP